jgi:hypothetical protein
MPGTHFGERLYHMGGVPVGELDPTAGKVLYVNGTTWGSPAGDDSNEGTIESPLQSIAAALDLCTSEHNDYIYVMDYWTGNSETKPIAVDVDNVHIIGRTGCGMPWPVVYVSGATAGFNITAAHVEIAGFHVYGGATSGCIEISANAKGVEIHHCTFGERTTGQDGIRVNSGYDAAELYVHDNMFGAQLTRYGVYLVTTATWARINHNSFVSVANKNIYCPTGGAVLAEICYNRFAQHSDTKGLAITVAGNNCLITGNVANIGVAAASNNPYLDTGSNDWILNYIKGITASMPATS